MKVPRIPSFLDGWAPPDDRVHDDGDPGCGDCGTCIPHDGCADPANPLDLSRGDCAACGACGACVADCAAMRVEVDYGLEP